MVRDIMRVLVGGMFTNIHVYKYVCGCVYEGEHLSKAY